MHLYIFMLYIYVRVHSISMHVYIYMYVCMYIVSLVNIEMIVDGWMIKKSNTILKRQQPIFSLLQKLSHRRKTKYRKKFQESSNAMRCEVRLRR